MASASRTPNTQFALLPEPLVGFDFVARRKLLCEHAEARADDERLEFACAVTSTVTADYWERVCAMGGGPIPIRMAPLPFVEVSNPVLAEYAAACSELDSIEAFFQIGELYTALLPAVYRTRQGIYYTPPQLVDRLLDMLEAQGADWACARILDPACGGAAFTAHVARRLLLANASLSPAARMRDLGARLVGFELDPFAAWLSAVLLDVVCLPLLRVSNMRLDGVVRLGNTLAQRPQELGLFDVIVGNPPYGKLTLEEADRVRFKRSLFGHANIYGVFTDLSVSLARPGGLIGFVTPTSFLGGEYFKNLRHLMVEQASPVHAGFVTDREGVFSNVLQETMLTVFRRKAKGMATDRGKASRITVDSIQPRAGPSAGVESLGLFAVGQPPDAPWILPRSRKQATLVRRLGALPDRLSDYGYRVATGQLVWNRHKEQFRDGSGDDCYPVLWAECIQPGGVFEFRSVNRNHRPYIWLSQSQDFLINQEPCVLVQRTTSKEQNRRLMAAVVPNSFVIGHPGFVVENHVNMVVVSAKTPAVPLWVLARLLNSEVADQAFRCISGSVAVSAYELEGLPMPSPDLLMKRLRLARIAPESPRFDALVESLYLDAR